MHYARVGAGSSSWSTAYPEWIGSFSEGRYARPGEPEYEAALERLRVLRAREAALT